MPRGTGRGATAALRFALPRLGLRADRLGPDAALLQRRGSRRLRVRELGEGAWLVEAAGGGVRLKEFPDDRAWLLQRGDVRPLVARGVGRPGLGLYLAVRERLLRRRTGRFEDEMMGYLSREHVAWTLRRLEANCVLDVGANVGQYARHLRRCGYRGRIVSFEPVASLAAELRAAAADDPEWRVVECALGEEEGTAEIQAGAGTMASLLPASEFGRSWTPLLTDTRPETVRVRRLDSVFDEAVAGLAEPRVFLKLDTQGYDLAALRGAGARLQEVVGLQSEVACLSIYDGMPRLPEQLAAYEQAGFEVTGFFPVSRHRPTMRVIEFDVVMVRPGEVRPGEVRQAVSR